MILMLHIRFATHRQDGRGGPDGHRVEAASRSLHPSTAHIMSIHSGVWDISALESAERRGAPTGSRGAGLNDISRAAPQFHEHGVMFIVLCPDENTQLTIFKVWQMAPIV